MVIIVLKFLFQCFQYHIHGIGMRSRQERLSNQFLRCVAEQLFAGRTRINISKLNISGPDEVVHIVCKQTILFLTLARSVAVQFDVSHQRHQRDRKEHEIHVEIQQLE